MNYSDQTRKDQVLSRLQATLGEWVDGSYLATETVGGSEGLKRLRELRDEGWPIERRKHPDPARAIWQYRLTGEKAPRVDPVRHIEVPDRPPDPPTIEEDRFRKMPRQVVFGDVAICPYCHGTKRYAGKPCIRCNALGIVPNKGPVPWGGKVSNR